MPNDNRPAFEPLMTTAEVAEVARVHPKTVARWADEGKLRVTVRTPGGHRRYSESDVRALLEPEPRP